MDSHSIRFVFSEPSKAGESGAMRVLSSLMFLEDGGWDVKMEDKAARGPPPKYKNKKYKIQIQKIQNIQKIQKYQNTNTKNTKTNIKKNTGCENGR